MRSPTPPLRAALAALALVATTSCTTLDTTGVTPSAAPVVAEAPQYRVGDRWVYRVLDGFAYPIEYEETRTVSSVGADGITVRVTFKGGRVDMERTERWPAPGLMSQGSLFDIETRRFATPVERYRFPLRQGASWNQHVFNYNEFTDREGRINRHVRVVGYDRVTTAAGTFDAVRMNVVMRLDDEEFWRWPTDCTYTIWYAPATKSTVRELKRAGYIEKGGDFGNGSVPAQYQRVELVSFTPGA